METDSIEAKWNPASDGNMLVQLSLDLDTGRGEVEKHILSYSLCSLSKTMNATAVYPNSIEGKTGDLKSVHCSHTRH